MNPEQPDPRLPSPRRLIQLLEEAGWRQVSGRGDQYLRLAPQGQELDPRRQSLLVPLNPEAPDFPELMREAVDALQRLPGDSTASTLLSRLTTSPTDQFAFAKETSAPRGWIQWDQGESLIASARGILIAGAKTAREHLTYFGNRYGQFANRFLDEVMMGQTAVSSYVIRAYVPVDRPIPIRSGRDAADGVHFVGLDTVSSREVSQTVIQTLASTVEAIDHFRQFNSMSAFTSPKLALSYEAVTAVRKIATDAEYANITVSWEPSEGGVAAIDHEFTFTAGNVAVLERAAGELIQTEPPRRVSAVGTVHLLSRSEAGGPGTVGMTTLSGEPANKLRVRLSEEDYHRALSAHDQGHIVHVTGDLEREGNLAWLYHAHVSGVVEPQSIKSASQEDDSLF